jgi:nucleoside-diphosphate-sugar epimerase
MNILVTGAAGFLGRSFTRHLVAAGHEVWAIDDMSAEHARWPFETPPERRRECDAGWWFTDGAFEWRADHWPTYFDRIYHFAAPVGGRMKIEYDQLYNADSLRLDMLMFRYAAKHARVAVYPSSSAVYGTVFQEDDGHTSLSEEMFIPNDGYWERPDSMYGFTKLAGEVLACTAAEYGLATLCIRPFSGYGEEQPLDYPMPAITARAARKENPLMVWGSGLQTRDFIHVTDVVGATEAMLDQGLHGYQALNIGTGIATSFREVARLAANIVGYAPTIKTDESKPVGVANRYADTERMRAVYTPKVSLEEGIELMVRSR